MIFNAKNFDIFRLGSVPVSYGPKNINTAALLVTFENIGALSLEFESELLYDKEGEPYFNINAARPTEKKPDEYRVLQVFAGDWLVILWNEIRLFRQDEFEQTFQVDHTNMFDVEEKPEGATQIMPRVGNVEEKPPIPQGNLDGGNDRGLGN